MITMTEFVAKFRAHILRVEGTNLYTERGADGRIIGYSKFGVSSHVWKTWKGKALNIAALTFDQAMQIYYEYYFCDSGIAALYDRAPKTAFCLFDCYVNQSFAFSKKLIKDATARAGAVSDTDNAVMVLRARLVDYDRLKSLSPTYAKSYNSWSNRIDICYDAIAVDRLKYQIDVLTKDVAKKKTC
jgi:lysozyme family protein